MAREDRWDAKTIAMVAGVSPAAVSNWRHRHAGSFPKADSEGTFDAQEVRDWLRSTGRGAGLAPRVSPAERWMRASDSEVSAIDAIDIAEAADPSRAMAPRWSAIEDLIMAPFAPRFGPEQAVKQLQRAGARHADAIGILLGLIAIEGLGGRRSDGWPRDFPALERGLNLPRGCLEAAMGSGAGVPRAALDEVAHDIAGLRLGRPEAQQMFERLLEEAGPDPEHVTNAPLQDFLCDLLPGSADSLLDPACGFGGLLVAAARLLGPRRVTGFEIDRQSWAISVLRCALFGIEATIVRSDFFKAQPAEHDIVLVQPPVNQRFGAQSAGARLVHQQFPSWAPRSAPSGSDINRGDLVWLLGAHEALAPGGTAFVVTSPGTAYAGQLSDARRELVRTGAVGAIVSLPRGLVGGKLTPGMIWVLRRLPEPPRALLFVNAESLGPRPSTDRLAEVAEKVRAWCDAPDSVQTVPGLIRAVPLLDVMAGSAELVPAKWTSVPTANARALIDARRALRALQIADRQAQQTTAPRLSLRARPKPELVTLGQLARDGRLDVQRPGHILRSELDESGGIPYATRVDDAGLAVTGHLQAMPDRAVVTSPGDVVLSILDPPRAVVDEAGGHVLGASLWLIRPRVGDPQLDPRLLTLLLSNPRIAARTVGNTVRRLRQPDDVAIPLLPVSDAEAFASWMAGVQASAGAARLVVETADEAVRSLAGALDTGAGPP